jgi:predicted metalloprotease
VDIQGRRRSENFEDRGRGASGGRRGIGGGVLSLLLQTLGIKGTLIIGGIAAVGYFVLPEGIRQALLGAVTGGSAVSEGSGGAGSVCQASAGNGAACDFSRAVLASTEDVWTEKFGQAALPRYGAEPGPYAMPSLVVFADGVSTGGCGNASSDVGPFYCPADRKLYIDPGFYEVMEQKLKAAGDFAQAYVIAHEVGHHVQNLIGSNQLRPKGDSENQSSVRVELQADCFAGVWGHTAKASLKITAEDLTEALNAAHQIGDDALGHSNSSDYTHGSSVQRKRWFERGFESGDPRKCDTFAVPRYADL